MKTPMPWDGSPPWGTVTMRDSYHQVYHYHERQLPLLWESATFRVQQLPWETVTISYTITMRDSYHERQLPSVIPLPWETVTMRDSYHQVYHYHERQLPSVIPLPWETGTTTMRVSYPQSAMRWRRYNQRAHPAMEKKLPWRDKYIPA